LAFAGAAEQARSLVAAGLAPIGVSAFVPLSCHK
jgi:hypothetical protein